MPEEHNEAAPNQRTVHYLSKTQIKKEWAKLDLDDLEKPPPSEEALTLNELYEDDLFGLGNE
ncbi:hypothetical protein [Nitrospina watsonii]|uniref:Uncharacterized protein n=1 Tax=Nitrospina watsonii TaxID=1323948 RepID=A0ABN8W618_9BACT|nr:hypothetical protein [Nitrospina watsonii]CAI2719706.1 conserved protein of unknown function [Nitrospina watsonii]